MPKFPRRRCLQNRWKNAFFDPEKRNELGALPAFSKTPFSEPSFRVPTPLPAITKPDYEISRLAFLLLTRLDAATPAGILNLFHADDQQRLCRLLSEAGAMEQALAVWPAIQSPTQADEAARHLATAVARIKGRAAALPLLENIKDPYTQDLTRADIADISAKAQDISGARQLLSEIAESHTLQRVTTLCALAQSIHADDATKALKEAWRLVERLRRNPADQAIKAVALASIAIAELAAGYPNYSDRTFHDALDVADTLPSVAARAKCLSDLAQGHSKLPQATFPPRQSTRRNPPDPQTNAQSATPGVAPPAQTTLSDDLLLRFAKQLSEAGDDDAAITISKRIRSNEQKAQALASIVANSHQKVSPSRRGSLTEFTSST